MIKVGLVKRLRYALFGYMTVDVKCPHGKFLTGTYQAGWSTHWGCDDCPLRIDIQWHDKENINHE